MACVSMSGSLGLLEVLMADSRVRGAEEAKTALLVYSCALLGPDSGISSL